MELLLGAPQSQVFCLLPLVFKLCCPPFLLALLPLEFQHFILLGGVLKDVILGLIEIVLEHAPEYITYGYLMRVCSNVC